MHVVQEEEGGKEVGREGGEGKKDEVERQSEMCYMDRKAEREDKQEAHNSPRNVLHVSHTELPLPKVTSLQNVLPLPPAVHSKNAKKNCNNQMFGTRAP